MTEIRLKRQEIRSLRPITPSPHQAIPISSDVSKLLVSRKFEIRNHEENWKLHLTCNNNNNNNHSDVETMPSRFDVLGQDESSNSSSSSNDEYENNTKQLVSKKKNVIVPSYEDLSMIRVDEETVLSAVYGADFSKKEGAWGSTKMCVNVKPPDLAPEHVGTELT